MEIFSTERLSLRELNADDAAFILRLVNEPAWRQYIGDRGIRTLEAAARYIETGPKAMYARLGFGLWAVERRADRRSIGICGLIKRDALNDIDLGFAFLSEHWGNGYALEAAAATMAYARSALSLERLVAVCAPGNAASIRLLTKLGFRPETSLLLPGQETEVTLLSVSL